MKPDRPSKNLMTTLPRTASHTTTSASCRVRSLPSMLPVKLRSVSSSSSVARWIRASPLPFSSPIESRATRGLSTPSTRSEKIAPICANWARFSAVESGLAPMSRSTNGLPALTIWIASAGRSTPFRRPSRRTAAAIPAPVWPAVTTASASPRRTRSVATRMVASFFSRSAIAGCSSMPTTWLAWTIRTLGGRSPASRMMTAVSPTRMTVSAGLARAYATAPGTISVAPWSPPMASTATRTPVVGPAGRLATGPLRASLEFSPSLTNGLRGLLARRRPAGRLERDGLPAVVPPARRADPVRQLRLVAMRALDERRQGEGVVAPPVHLPRVSDLSLRHTHVGLLLLAEDLHAGRTPRIGLWWRGSRAVAGARTRRRMTWGRAGSLLRLGILVHAEGEQRRHPRVDGPLPVAVTGLHALPALGAQAGTVGLAQRGDRLLQADGLRDQRPQLQLVMVGQPWRLRVAPLLERDGLAAAQVDGREDLLVDPRIHRRDDRPQAAGALPREGGVQPGVDEQAPVGAGEAHPPGDGLRGREALLELHLHRRDVVLADRARGLRHETRDGERQRVPVAVDGMGRDRLPGHRRPAGEAPSSSSSCSPSGVGANPSSSGSPSC